ncbi:GNAT family N-acetyltransferase [Streptacidiphilus sp. ASG 303]|uniref:GNAT family N-acetyltransferase n=1 Tax=Streptacidiphilus sp. ASG 303 TaxID=2896847 RepID=UPI001E398D60|nr:GNAT family N-acetyltransferase [Streptacidiphilus sp. ASG 303]MCD0483842.1 GNAT family N-acetyltransferase [Streptacidiphilus sp. ASG 303]
MSGVRTPENALGVRIEPWSEEGLELLRRINTPEMKRHVGGPETEEQVLARHRRYLGALDGRMFRVLLPGGEAVGTVGYWARVWRGEAVYESGWNVLPSHQGRGVAAAAVAAVLHRARAEGRHRYLHAFPSVDNPASNALCRRAGFVLLGECDFPYPPGSGRTMRSNDWRLDLAARTDAPGGGPEGSAAGRADGC